MEHKEIIGLAFFAFALIFTVGMLWRLKRMAESRKALDAKFDEVTAKLNAKNDIDGMKELARARVNQRGQRKVSAPTTVSKTRTTTQTQTVSGNSVGIQSRGSVSINNDSDDLLTTAMVWHALNSNTGAVSASVDYNTNTVEVREEPVSRSSYTSSYSSSSSDDDSSSRSSYSSSYSSSSSDSSYSSSSSDSSSSSSDW